MDEPAPEPNPEIISPEMQIGLFRMFWRWLLVVGALFLALNTVLGAVTAWAIYDSATQEAKKMADEQIEKYRAQISTSQKTIDDLVISLTRYEQKTADAADKSKSDSSRASDLVDQANDLVRISNLLVNASSKTGISPDSLDQAARNALADYFKSSAFTTIFKPSMVVSFVASKCPEPWVEYEPAYGRFVRGIDPTGKIDPDGVRAFGSTQTDGLASHTHTMGVNGGDSFSMAPGGATQRLANFAPDGYGAGPPKQTAPNAGGLSETRPKNVALLYCMLKQQTQ
jgi:hypothetical protein